MKKFTKKQLAAQRLFAKRAKAGAFKKKISKKARKSKLRIPKRARPISMRAPSQDSIKAMQILKLLQDPNVKEITIKK